MTYLITGGSGFLGINLIRHLLARGAFIRSFDIAPFSYPEAADIEAVTGDIRDFPALLRAMRDVDAVVHCAAALPLYSEQDIVSTDILGTRNVLEAARVSGISRVVHISSTAVYGILAHCPAFEDAPLVGVGPYGKAKIAAESACLDYRARGMCVPVIRPKSFVGPERLGVFSLLYDWASSGKHFPIIGNGRNRYQLLDVADLCSFISLALSADSRIANATFNVGAREFLTVREEYQAVLDRAGFGKRVIAFPASPAIFALRALHACRLSPIYPWVYETAGKDSYVSIAKAERDLGYVPRYSNVDALLRNYEWYLANPPLPHVSGISHRVPWSGGALRFLKAFF